VLLRSSPPPADLWIAYPSGRLPPARVRVFVDLLVAQARAAPGWKVDLSDEE
jgi:DNA-binding transcriptional LysR family regulator